MMPLQNRLSAFADAIAPVCDHVYHYWRKSKQAPYVIWQEGGENESFNADNRKGEQNITCTCDCFTHTEFDPLLDDIQELLEENTDGWRLLSAGYEEETNLIHYEWEFDLGWLDSK